MSRRSELDEGYADHPGGCVIRTSNTSWLEETDSRRSESPEEVLSRLEDLLDAGEIDETELTSYYKANYK